MAEEAREPDGIRRARQVARHESRQLRPEQPVAPELDGRLGFQVHRQGIGGARGALEEEAEEVKGVLLASRNQRRGQVPRRADGAALDVSQAHDLYGATSSYFVSSRQLDDDPGPRVRRFALRIEERLHWERGMDGGACSSGIDRFNL